MLARPSLALAVALLGAEGCAVSLSTFQPYETLKPRAMHFSTGYSVNAPVSQSVRSVRSTIEVVELAADRYEWDGGTMRMGAAAVERDAGIDTIPASKWAEAAAGVFAVLLTTPGFSNEYMFRLGIIKDVDVGLRWAWSTLRLDAKFQLYRYKPSRRFDMGLSLDVGGGYHFFSEGTWGTLFEVLDYVEVDKFRRIDGEASLIFGMSWGTYDSVMLWLGPKVILSHYVVDGSLSALCDPMNEFCAPDTYRLVDAGDTKGGIGLYGGFVGMAFGYRWIWFVVEMTAMWMVAKHHLLPGLLKEETDLGGLIVFPSWGFMGRFEL